METKQKYFRRRGKRGVIYLQERHDGTLLNDCLNTTDAKIAEIRRREIHISVERGDYLNFKVKFKTGADDFVKEITRGSSDNTKRIYRTVFEKHLTPRFGEARFGDIKQSDLLEYKRFRETQGAGQVALTHEMWLFRRYTASKGVIIKPIKDGFVKPAVTVDRFPTEPEVLAIIEQTKGEQKAAFLVLAYSGLRKRDCLAVQWNHIDFQTGFIKKRQKKTGKLVRIPLHEKLLEALARIPRGVGETPVFRCTAKSLDYHWVRARKKVDLEWVRIHDLRHFYASFLASRKVATALIGEILGHRDLKSTARYAKFDDQSLHDAVSVFDKKSVAKSLPKSGER